MSDRRPSKLYDPAGALEWWRAEGSKLTLVQLYEAIHDPVAVVRRGVESGTIKGEVVEAVRHMDANIGKWCLEVGDHGTYLVIPVSDGGSET